VVDLEDEEDDVKHEEAPPAAAGNAHGTPQLIRPGTIAAQLAAEVCVKLSSEPFLRELVSPSPHHSLLTTHPNHQSLALPTNPHPQP
jgi:hypothetical protein